MLQIGQFHGFVTLTALGAGKDAFTLNLNIDETILVIDPDGASGVGIVRLLRELLMADLENEIRVFPLPSRRGRGGRANREVR
jgi:hypothetical protein